MHGRVARKLPYVSKANMTKRLKFYTENILKSPEYWKKILWTDESMVRLSHSHGRIYVWRRKSEEFSYKCSRPTLKSLGNGLKFWGCISANGPGKIVILEGKVNADLCLKLLKKTAIPEGRRLLGADFTLQQDNARIHKAKKVQKYLVDNNINVLEWPPQSPDLSPIENIWALLKLRISHREPRNIIDLKQLIVEEWNSITSEVCKKFIQSIPNRLNKISRNNGRHCGY